MNEFLFTYFQVKTVVMYLVFGLIIIAWTMDRISKRQADLIDRLNKRVAALESEQIRNTMHQ
jgi:L-asparagine transporter-like permease